MFFALMMVVMATELMLSLFWNRAYFSWGLRVYERRIAARPAALASFRLQQVESEIVQSPRLPMVCRPLSADTCAFRESGWVRVFPMMRGLIVLDRRRRRIRVIGWCNWVLLPILGLVIVGFWFNPAASWLALAFLAVNAYFQKKRFDAVADAVETVLAFNSPLPPVPQDLRGAAA